MCGIVGWVNEKNNLLPLKNKIEEMTQTLEKRGPDDFRYFTEEHVLFGHRRLIVVDPLNGIQPMHYENMTLIYNGELYNTEEVRAELLEHGYTFNGHSDTEVLLKAYHCFKEDVLEKINGIYAFAVWDQERLFLARDRVGVKPLFYAQIGNDFIFASEMKAILKSEVVKPIINRDGLSEILALGPSKNPPSGVFKDIKELRAAHYLIYENCKISIQRYWNVVSKKHEDTLVKTIENVRYLVTDAIKRQLVSDVNLCTLLSGGLDSSIISAIAAMEYKKNNTQLHTFSIDYEGNDIFFEGNDYQISLDREYIELVSQQFDTIHHYEKISQEELVRLLNDAYRAKDLPGMADIDSSLLYFARQIQKEFTVSLSGECADEIFGGYPWFYREDLKNLNTFPWIRYIEERENLLNPSLREILNIKEYLDTKYKEAIEEVPYALEDSEEDKKLRNLFYLNLIYFMPTLLDRKDRMTMGASIEVRVPFSDHRIIEYLWNVPFEYKMLDGKEKGLLRKAFEGVLPEEVLYRKKNPYPKTHNPLFAELVTKLLTERLQNNESVLHILFDEQALKQLLDSKGDTMDKPFFGQLMTGPQFIAYLYQLDCWFEEYKVELNI